MVIDFKLRKLTINRTLISGFMGIVLLMVLFPISVLGAVNPYVSLDSNKGVSAVIDSVNSYSKEYDFKLLYIGDYENVTIDMERYNRLDNKDKRKVMEGALNSIQNSNLTGRDKSRFYNFMQEQDSGTARAVSALSNDVTTDVVSASNIMRPFTSPLSIFLGVMSIAIFFMLSMSMAIDIFFLAIPIFQGFILKNGDTKPKVISQGAWDAIKTSESNVGTDKSSSVWGFYLRSQTITIIFVGITLAYLIGGRVFDLASFIVNVFERAFS